MRLCGQNQIPMWPDSYALVTVLTATKTSHTGGGHTEASTEVTVSITLKGCSCNHMTLLCMWHLYWGVCGCTVEAGMWWSDDMNGFSNALSTENFVITVTLRKIRHKHKLTWVTSELGTNPSPPKKKQNISAGPSIDSHAAPAQQSSPGLLTGVSFGAVAVSKTLR